MKATMLLALGLGLAALPVEAQQSATPPDSTLNPWVSPYCQMMHGSWAMMGGNPGAMMNGYRSMMGGSRGAMMGEASGVMVSQRRGVHMTMEGQGMMLQAMRLWPQALIAQRQQLGLTDAQVAALQKLTDQPPISAEQRDAINQAQDHLAEAFDQSDSTTMVREAQEVGRLYGELQAHQLEIASQARSVLTEQQRELLASQPAACRGTADEMSHAWSGSDAAQPAHGRGGMH
jgi:hypothetical protein